MPFSIHTYTNIWLIWHQVDVEIDANKALPTIEIIGLPDASIKESKERIRATLRNTWVDLPPRKIVLNLAPSHIKKIGTRFDVPMTVAILALIYEPTWVLKDILETSLFFGELWLDWSIKKITGILPSVISAYKQWWKVFFVPQENVAELEYLEDITLYSLSTFSYVVEIFESKEHNEKILVKMKKKKNLPIKSTWKLDQIRWQILAKRALVIAAAWMHNVLMVWPPWSGKTMLARWLQSLLPPLTFQETLDVSQIYSVIWWLSKEVPLIIQRPFRCVHHTASRIAIVWWWQYLTPWEVSLSHTWILFFDELPEFPREVLEVLRQPLEDKCITISRASWSVQYPSNFMFVAAMNPCKCGFYRDREKKCICSLSDVKRYQSKISWPLLDRFDLILEIPRENIDVVLDTKYEAWNNYANEVMQARELQRDRYKGTWYITNSQLSPHLIQKHITLTSDAELFLKDVVKRLHLSPRVAHKAMKLWRTIADLQKKSVVEKSHIAEALQFRQKTMFVDQ